MIAAAAAAITSCLSADHHQLLPVKSDRAAPTQIAAVAVATTAATMAAVPEVISHGMSGTRAPRANVANEEVAAWIGDPSEPGVMPSSSRAWVSSASSGVRIIS